MSDSLERIVFAIDTACARHGPEDLVDQSQGALFEHEDGAKSVKVGKIDAYRIHIEEAMNCGESLADMFDTHSTDPVRA